MVARLLAKEKVAGSNPVFRSKTFRSPARATWPSGKAGVCKTPITGSNPVVASNPLPKPVNGDLAYSQKVAGRVSQLKE